MTTATRLTRSKQDTPAAIEVYRLLQELHEMGWGDTLISRRVYADGVTVHRWRTGRGSPADPETALRQLERLLHLPIAEKESMPPDMVFGQGGYADAGCPEVSPSCLDCPLPQCKDDDPKAFQRWKQRQRDLATLANPESVTVRTLFRIRKRLRESTLA